jgi:YD repeat-containing protein
MAVKIFVLALLGVFACCFMSSPAHAQTGGGPCLAFQTWWPVSDGPFPLGSFYYSQYPGTFAVLLASYTGLCGGSATPAEARCNSHDHTCSNPITLTTGNTFIVQNDLSLPGLGGGLSLKRTWNSMWPPSQLSSQIGIFGPNWRSTYEDRVFNGSDGNIKYSRADGSYWSFTSGTTPQLISPANLVATLIIGTPYNTVTFQNGEQRRFDSTSGSLTAIIDPNGNTATVSYDGTNRLVTVTDAVARHLYFNYPNGSSRLVSSVTSDFGVSLSYVYDVQNRLSVVTFQDGSTATFAYDANSLVTSVTDSQGKILEAHTYDSKGRGLTSSQANGVNAVTITYPQ